MRPPLVRRGTVPRGSARVGLDRPVSSPSPGPLRWLLAGFRWWMLPLILLLLGLLVGLVVLAGLGNVSAVNYNVL